MKRKININDFNSENVWSYTRVSTKDQFVNNGSIETQVKTIKKFAKENNLIISEEFDAEYESSKRIKSQSTLKELTEKIKRTHHTKRPKIILIWSPSRFGRGGAEHIGLFVDLRKKSPTFGKHFKIVLDAEKHTQLFIPREFAHGFLVLSDTAGRCWQ